MISRSGKYNGHVILYPINNSDFRYDNIVRVLRDVWW